MHDIRAIRDNPDAFDAALARRGEAAQSRDLLALDEARRACIHAAETARADQNRASKEVGAARARGDEAEFERLRALVADKKAEVAAMQAEARDLDAQLTARLAMVPNHPAADVPDPHFALLAKIAARNGLYGLSMGMSADFATAIEQGATHVRVGSAIFGHRGPPAP